MLQVALRRQQAQEEAEARQLGVEILKPGDRAELVMGPGDTAGEEQGEAQQVVQTVEDAGTISPATPSFHSTITTPSQNQE